MALGLETYTRRQILGVDAVLLEERLTDLARSFRLTPGQYKAARSYGADRAASVTARTAELQMQAFLRSVGPRLATLGRLDDDGTLLDEYLPAAELIILKSVRKSHALVNESD